MRRAWLAAIALALLPAPAAAQHEPHQHPAPIPNQAPPAQKPPADAQAHHAPADAPPASVRPLTDADRAAAFPDVGGHAVHDAAINTFVLFDQLEWQGGANGAGLSWDVRGWMGGDRDRLWFRSEGTRDGGRLEEGSADLLYGRAVSPWWDLVAGVRRDVRPGPGRTWAAFGIQGLAPYWIHVEATAYLSAGGRTQLCLKAEHELLITNRLVLQPLVEVDFYGKDDLEREVAAGLSSMDAGFRLRYEVRRELAPYVGVTWRRTFFGTAAHARAHGHAADSMHVVAGVRFWM
jgi:copper resistance protein B